ncbi:unnamed protein product [Parnassius mnemosyne]|uniref:DDE-1 domain-containing protein n=1 Tax=Parnassius mnemosyne TaxID=213953 RepID=A0AAV1L9K2_9NEOP
MPRVYKPDPRGRRYKKYDTNIIQKAVDEYSEGGSSLDTIAKKYQIHRSVLYRHCHKTMKTHGGQTVLSKDTEQEFIKYINICANWGYPLEAYDLRLLVKLYLDRLGVNEKRFKNNMPGPDFVASFLKRHRDVISHRISQNIKRNRAAVSEEIIKKYFEELKISLNDVCMCNVINYDETNLADDPGRKKIIARKGTKYPERVMNHSKSAVSVMFSCTAEGDLLPPYVVYKSQNLYDTWISKGPKGTRYNRSQSGWFDGPIFEDWVKSIIIPYFQGKSGKKILIGDNLSSHLSIDLIKLCYEEDIHFIFLPANSTHITQPLDVAFFRPMKMAWRNIIFQWKKTDGRKLATIPKGYFPTLLSKLIDTLKVNAKENILAGFRKTGINPFDPIQVLNRLPEHEDNKHRIEAVNESVLDILKEMRYGTTNVVEPKRKRKIEVEPGKCASVEESYVETEVENREPKKKQKKTEKRVKDTKKDQNECNNEQSTFKGKGVGKKTKTPLNAPIVENEPTLTDNYLGIESMPVVMFGDDIVIDHTETVENDNKNYSDNTISNNEIKESDKVKILSDISITNSKLVKDTISIGALKLIPPSTKLKIISKAAIGNKQNIIRNQPKKLNYYRNDEEIIYELMKD